MACYDNQLMFFDFIDSVEKVKQEKLKEDIANQNDQMKKIFAEIDTEGNNRLNMPSLQMYF